MAEKDLAIIFAVIIFLVFVFWPSDNIQKINENIADFDVSYKYKDPFSHTNETHWDHMPITFDYDENCSTIFQSKMEQDIYNALEFISNRTDYFIRFKKIVATDEDAPDILFICDIGGVRRGGWEPGFFTFAEAIPYIYTGTNIYAPSRIYIYSTYECLGKRPTLIIHEVAHLFGLGHNTRPSYSGDIMHPYESNTCEEDFLSKDIKYLKEIYTLS